MTTQIKERVENYKETNIGELPGEWEVAKLGDVADYINGYPFKPSDWGKEGLPIIRIQNLTGSQKKTNYYGNSLSDKYKVSTGDFLISWSASLGIFMWNKGDAWVNQHIFKVTNFSDCIARKFFYFAASTIIAYMKSRSRGSTMRHITKLEFLDIKIPLPPLQEQKKIAHVLSTVQAAQEKTERKIDALKELKKSAMKHLFQYGVVSIEDAENVKLKESEIGEILEGWEVKKLVEVANIKMGQSPPGKTYNITGEGKPFLQGKAEFGSLKPTHSKYTTTPTKIAEEGSVLLSVRAPVGDVNLADKEYCIGRGLAAISLIKGGNLFLFYVLTYLQPKIEQEGTGSTFKAINKSKVENFCVPLPPLQEQKQIASILFTIDRQIQTEEDKKEAYHQLFNSLLKNLITGKTRVETNA